MKKLIKSDKLHHQVILSFFVSVASLIVDFSTLWALTELASLHYLTSAAVGFLLGIFVNYFLNIKFVFPTRKLQNQFLEFHIFALIGLLGLAINHAIIWTLVEQFSIFYLLAKIASAGVTFCWNFAARKLTLFR